MNCTFKSNHIQNIIIQVISNTVPWTLDLKNHSYIDLRHGWCSQGHLYQVLGKYPKRDAAATRGTEARLSFVTLLAVNR